MYKYSGALGFLVHSCTIMVQLKLHSLPIYPPIPTLLSYPNCPLTTPNMQPPLLAAARPACAPLCQPPSSFLLPPPFLLLLFLLLSSSCRLLLLSSSCRLLLASPSCCPPPLTLLPLCVVLKMATEMPFCCTTQRAANRRLHAHSSCAALGGGGGSGRKRRRTCPSPQTAPVGCPGRSRGRLWGVGAAAALQRRLFSGRAHRNLKGGGD